MSEKQKLIIEDDSRENVSRREFMKKSASSVVAFGLAGVGGAVNSVMAGNMEVDEKGLTEAQKKQLELIRSGKIKFEDAEALKSFLEGMKFPLEIQEGLLDSQKEVVVTNWDFSESMKTVKRMYPDKVKEDKTQGKIDEITRKSLNAGSLKDFDEVLKEVKK